MGLDPGVFGPSVKSMQNPFQFRGDERVAVLLEPDVFEAFKRLFAAALGRMPGWPRGTPGGMSINRTMA